MQCYRQLFRPTSVVFFMLLAATLLVFAQGAVIQRNAGRPQNVCQNSTPCAWAVYNQFTRKIDYLMRNSCVCPEGKECQRTDEDVSIAAFVYRCR